MPPPPSLAFTPPCGTVTVESTDAFEEEEEADVEADFRCCKSIVPVARENPKLDRRAGRRKAKENSLEAGNEEDRESDAVLREGVGVGEWMEFIVMRD